MARKLGQHFLYDPKIAAKMCEAAEITRNDTVLEIGPGKGLITKELAARAKQVIAVEKDSVLADSLKGFFGKNVEIINDDILAIGWPRFDKIVSNIPFEISSPLLEKIFEARKTAVLILQKEFAARLLAKPGEKDYSKLTVKCNYYCTAEKIGELKPGAFRPAPKVSAAIVRLTPKKPPFEADEKLWETANILFQHRRKTVRAALKGRGTNRIPDTLLKKRVFNCTLEDIRSVSDSF
ncbi:MAG: 16S rRNA (adenine(1518)-N(6)/adenine(1519)-N(6))-dimethyltransferase RsmA [Candidatus Aenigmatarchaeota archaeon]